MFGVFVASLYLNVSLLAVGYFCVCGNSGFEFMVYVLESCLGLSII